MSSQCTPIQISIPQHKLDYIRKRVQDYPWEAITTFDPSWSYGPPPDELRAICEYWTSRYDWRKTENTINTLSHFKTTIQDQELHFVHEKGSGSNPQPLLLIHGWPYSFHSYTQLIPRLAHPERFGGRVEDACTVVVPSLPGFGFSSKPKGAVHPKHVREILNELMTSVLGYQKYISHGGDWGSYISEWLGFSHPESCIGIHLTMSSVRHHGGRNRTEEYVDGASQIEMELAKKEKELWEGEQAYSLLQCTKPLKLAYAMMDSPVGAAAWILEAFYAWSDLRGMKLTDVYTMEQLLDEVMLYLVTDTFNTSTWIYAGDYESGESTFPEGEKIKVPVGILACPDPVFPMPPKEVLERSRTVTRWRDSTRGGHFPFYEVPDTLVEDLLAFTKELSQ
ncbi:epoxide hydrolase [Polyplosphaeria fusca]|uniref:Epoxide hydrolase n=1 Tax=Polyplosphaeria fusca TaxID=682080 RepID=A0A9P4V5R6_9PLEO|nr:epoxide hydrolase [Polyplosphaeria fusca]